MVTAARQYADLGGWARLGLINFGAVLTLISPSQVPASTAVQAGLILIALGIAGHIGVLLSALIRAHH